MTDLKGIPAQDDFETSLSAMWNGGVGSMSVFAVPDGTLPVGEFSYIVVEPGTNNMQVAKISGWDSVGKTFTVSSIDVEKTHGVNYTAKTHPANSVVRVSNNFAFWKEIQSAINSKVSGTVVQATLFAVNWAGGMQTITVSGINSNNDVIISPVPTYMKKYINYGIYCSAQGINSLTFNCDIVPAEDIAVNIAILN